MNGVKIEPISEGERYRYLNQDENIVYDGPIKKERASKVYLFRVKKT